MGYYLNPKDMSKEQFLDKYGEVCMKPTDFTRTSDSGKEQIIVCWVHNGDFTAAGICVNQDEFDAFMHPDPRTKMWFWVDKELLDEYI